MNSRPRRTPTIRTRRRSRGEDGFAIIFVGLLLIPIMIATALAVDIGSWYARITQLQSSADAAALAGTIWMPDLSKATDVAKDSLLKNGINPDGSGGVTVSIQPGATSTSLKVSLTENKAKAYFSSVMKWNQALTRSAEAEYYLPLPLGSPLNYFGGDASKNAGPSDDPPSDYSTRRPNNYTPASCKVKGSSNEWWQSTGTFRTSSRPGGLANCIWASTIGQIDPTRSPGFWAAIGGPGDVAAYGDAFSSICTGTVDCGAPVQGNKMYRSTGYWYVIKMPSSSASSTTISIYDAGYDSSNGSGNNAGDTGHGGGDDLFTTEYRVYKQTNPLDINSRVPVTTGASNTDGSCWWQMTNQASTLAQWRNLCTLSAPANDDTYLLNVRTYQASNQGAGVNGYAVQAVSTGTRQPAVYAYGDMGMRNNVDGTTATFYLAEVGPEFAGKILTVDLWDPGDANDDATLYPMMPSSSAARPVTNVAQGDCTYTASPSPNTALSSGTGGATGTIVSSPHVSDVSGSCGVITNTGGSSGNKYNDEWLHLRIKVPNTYSCTKGLNPETTAGSCWWGIKYTFTGAANDVTTWKAAIEGNPVHLVE